MEKGQKARVRVVVYQPSIGDGFTIQAIHESPDFYSDVIYHSAPDKGMKLKTAIANQVIAGLRALDVGGADHFSVYLLKEEE